MRVAASDPDEFDDEADGEEEGDFDDDEQEEADFDYDEGSDHGTQRYDAYNEGDEHEEGLPPAEEEDAWDAEASLGGPPPAVASAQRQEDRDEFDLELERKEAGRRASRRDESSDRGNPWGDELPRKAKKTVGPMFVKKGRTCIL